MKRLSTRPFGYTAHEKRYLGSSLQIGRKLSVLALAAVFALAACSNPAITAPPSTGPGPMPDPIIVPDPTVPSVSLNTTALNLSVGGSATLTAIVSPANTTITWSSSNNAVATVNNGTVTAVAVGTTTITVTAASGKTATCTVIVATQILDVAVTDITGVPNTATIGTPLTLTGTVTPSNATNKTIVWSIDSNAGNQSAAIINNSQLVGHSVNGTTLKVRATVKNGTTQGTDYFKVFSITVKGTLSYGIQLFVNGSLLPNGGTLNFGTETRKIIIVRNIGNNPTGNIWVNVERNLEQPGAFHPIPNTQGNTPGLVFTTDLGHCVAGSISAGGSDTISLYFVANPDLAAGTYTGTVRLRYDGNQTYTFTASFTKR